MKKIASFLAAALALAFATLNGAAATYTWTGAGFGGDTDYLWSNPFNWLGLAAPATGESNLIIVLPNTGAPRTTTNDIAGLTVKSIRFQGDNYIVAGKTPGNTMALTLDRFTGDTIEATGDNGQFAPTLSLVLTNDITVDVAVGQTFAIRSSMSGPGGVAKSDMGTLHFNSPGNSYAGETYVTEGILDLQCGLFGPTVAVPHALFIGTTNLVQSAVVRLLNDDQIANTAPITVNANGKLWLNTHDDTCGALTLVGGLVNTGLGGGSSSPGLLTLNGNVTNRASGVNPFSTVSGRLSLDLVTRIFDVGTNGELGVDASISSAIGFTAGITKTGPGLLTFYNATNTYTGVTTINDGKLMVVLNKQLLGSTNAGTVINSPGQLHIADFVVGQESLTINGSLASDALIFEGSNYWAGPVSATGARIFGDDGEFLTLNGAVSGGALKTTGLGTIYLTGPNANTVFDLIVDRGDVILNKQTGVDAFGGRLYVGNTNDPQFRAQVIIRADQQFPLLASVTVYFSGLITTDNADETIGQLTLQGGWLVTLGGKVTLSGNATNLYFPQKGFIGGELVLANSQHFMHCAASSTLEINALISASGTGGITKTGPGRLILFNTNTYDGLTVVQDGFLVLDTKGRPGSAVAGTEIQSNGVLQLTKANVTNETLTLNGHPANYSVYVRDQCIWAGNVSLAGNAGVQFEIANGLTNKLTITGAISGPGGLRSDGDGELVLGGSGDNTFGGELWIHTSDARFQKSGGASAVNSSLRVGEPSDAMPIATLTYGANNQVGNSTPVFVDNSGTVALDTFTDTVGPLTMRGGLFTYFTGLLGLNGNVMVLSNLTRSVIFGPVSLGGVTRTFSSEIYGELSVLGVIQDGGGVAGIVKNGPGDLFLDHVNTYAGQTLINVGTLTLSGLATPGSTAANTVIAPGAQLGLYGSLVTNESLTLGADAEVTYIQTNVWSGPIVLNGEVQVHTIPVWGSPTDKWTVDGVISGPGGLDHAGEGHLEFAGTVANSYTGLTTHQLGNLDLRKTGTGANTIAIPGNLLVGVTNEPAASAFVRTYSSNQFAFGPSFRHVIEPSGLLLCNGFDQTIPALTLREGVVDSGGGLLTLAGDVLADTRPGPFSSANVYGHVLLGNGPNSTRTIVVTNNTRLGCYADIRSGNGATNILKLGPGSLCLEQSNSFSGLMTIRDGTTIIYDEHGLASPLIGTLIESNGSLVIESSAGTNHVAEPLTLDGLEFGSYSIHSSGTNELTGPIQILSYGSASLLSTNALLLVRSAISGPGVQFRKVGQGTVRLLGTNTNTFAGLTRVDNGHLELARTNVMAIAGPLSIGRAFDPPGSVSTRWLLPNQVADTSAVTIEDSGQMELQNNNDTIGSLAGFGKVLLGSATLTTGGNGANTSYVGFIAGIGGGLTKTGGGTFLVSANNTYTGTTTVNGGVLLVNGQQAQSAVSLLTGGTIGGYGRVGHISALNGHVSPGESPGNLEAGNLSFFSPASLLKIEINGTVPGVSYDQVDVTGTVLLMGGALQISMNFHGAISNQYVIVNNDGVDPASGTFTALPEGGSVTNNGFVFTISYHGGDGNDIVLTQQNVAVGPQIGSIQKLGNGSIEITAAGIPNTTYTVEATTSLNPPAQWDELGTVNSNGSGMIQFIDASDFAHFPIRFYRFRLP